MSSTYDDFVPVTGGVGLPKERVRDDLDRLSGVVVDSDLDKHILRLLALHADLRHRFGDPDLATLGEQAKRTLLEEMNEALGLRPSSNLQK